MNITSIFTGDRSIMVIGNKYNYWKLLGSIANKEAGSTDTYDPSLYFLTGTYSNVSICTISPPWILDRYFNTCYVIYNQNI